MGDVKIRIEDEMLGFFLCWNGGKVFMVYKQNGQKLGEWSLDHEPTFDEAEQEILKRKENGEYLNIIE